MGALRDVLEALGGHLEAHQGLEETKIIKDDAKNVKYSKNDVDIKWYYDGSLNVSYNCIDRHAKNDPDRIAIIWEGDDPNNVK